MFRQLFLQFSLLLHFSLTTVGQQRSYVFQHLTSKDNLASENVTCIFQDSKGFYWLGSRNGLQKFDGKNFAPATSSNGFRNTSVTTQPVFQPILEDNMGDIWIHHEGFISVYHSRSGQLSRIEIADDPMHPGTSDIRNFCRDDQGNIWIVTGENIYKYDYQKHQPGLWLKVRKLSSKTYPTYLIYDGIKKALWLLREMDISMIDIGSKKIRDPFLDEQPGNARIPGKQVINACWMDGKQNLWVSNWAGVLFKYNTVNFKRDVYEILYSQGSNRTQIIKPVPACFTEDSKGKVWIGSNYGGLSYYDEKENTIKSIPVNNNLAFSFHFNYYINALYTDSEGNIWGGTDKGINIFNPSFQQFTTIDENNVLNPASTTEVTSVFETSCGNILVSTWGNGWFVYDKDFRLKKHFYYTVMPGENHPGNKRNLVWSFAEGHDGKIWIGYQYGLIGIYDTTNQSIKFLDVPEFEKKTVMAIKADENGNLWFGLYSGSLAKWDKKSKDFVIYKNLLNLQPGENAIVNDILINDKDEIWVATNSSGFYCFNPEIERITERYAPGEPSSGTDNSVTSLTRVNDSVIGVSTSARGFLWFNKKQKTISSFTINDGLPTNYVAGLGHDKQKNLWIATTDGLLRLNPHTYKLAFFDEGDGLLNKQFIGHVQSLNGDRMAIPTSTGLVYFSPGNINDLPAPPDVQITGFKVFEQSLAVDSLLWDNKTVELNYKQNFITIGYASLSFLGKSTTRYFYKLENVDISWVSAGQQRFAGYTNLSPGHYRFRIKCENRDGVASKGITTLNIIIHPPWWATWWAYAFYILLGGTVAYAVYWNHIRSLKKKQSDQIATMVATQEEERKRISRDLHDDVGTKLSAIKLFLSSLREKAIATGNHEINRLARDSEDFISEAISDVRQLLLNLSPGVLEEFGYTTAVEGLVNKINETRQLHFSLVVFGIKQRFTKNYELALYRITQELINNILKHSEAKNVSLQIGERDEKIILMIEDDGKGFDVSNHNDGYGLQNIEARTKLLNGVITIDSQIGKGTSVLIEIPYHLNKI